MHIEPIIRLKLRLTTNEINKENRFLENMSFGASKNG